MCYVSSVVHTEADADYKAVQRGVLDRHAQHVYYAHHVHQGEHDAGQGEQAGSQVGHRDEDDDQDAGEGDADVS